MKKLLVLILALFALTLESKDSKGSNESKKPCCTVKVRKITAACAGQDTGKITFSVEGNTEPFKAVLKSATPGSLFKPRKISDIPHEATLEFECLPSDTYTLSLTSSCCSQCLTGIVVPEASPILVDIVTSTAACFGEENGTIAFTVTGGVPPYRAKLLNSHSQVVQRIPDIQPGVTTIIKDLPADTYSLVVTDSHGCRVTTKGIVVPQATQIMVQIGTITPTFPEFSTGIIPFTVTGGTPTYTAQLFNGTSPVPVQTISDIQPGAQTFFKNLPADTHYSIVITDSNDCQESVFGIVVPSSKVIVKVVEPVTPTCFGDDSGTIPFSVSGGTAPYTAQLFKLVNGIPQLVQTLTDIPEGILETFMGLSEGTYSISATDAHGELGSISGIRVNSLPALIVTPGPVTPTQPGESTGSIGLTVAGGAAPYTVQLFDNSVTPPILVQTITVSTPGTGLFSNLPAGNNYSLVITDANGCTETVSGIVVTSSVLVITLVKVTPVCFGEKNGSISFSVTGGTGTYTADLLNSQGQVVATLTDIQAGLVVAFSNLVADNNYKIVITDMATPPNRATVTNIVVKQSSQIIVQLGTIMPTIPGQSTGSIPFTVTGGNPNYTAQLFNGTSPVPVQTISDIQPGVQILFKNLPAATNYSLAITDSQGCQETISGIVVPSSPVVVKVVEPVTPTCFGDDSGTIPFSVSGGTAPYSAQLFKLVNGIPQLVQTIADIPEGVFETFMGLSEGTYSIRATDANGEPGSISGIVVNTLPAIIVTPGPVTPTLPGESTGSIGLMVAGGAAPYTVQLFDNSGTPPILVQTITVSMVGGTGLFSDLPAGTNYSLVITDANGCTETVSGIVVTSSVLIIALVKVTPASFGEMNGSISFSITGGTGPYTALVLNSQGQVVDTISNIQPGTKVTAMNLVADTYSISVRDVLGNTGSVTTIVVPQLSPIVLLVGTITPAFPGVANGTISFTVDGGLAPYTAQLLNSVSQVVQTLSNIQAGQTVAFVNVLSGTYTIRIIDSNGGLVSVTGIVVPTAPCNQIIVNDPFLAFYDQIYFGT